MVTAKDLRRALEAERFGRDDVRLAAFLGHGGARELEPGVPEAPAQIETLLGHLATKVPFEDEALRHVALVRAAIAMARPVPALAYQRRKHWSYEAFHAAESWTLCPCSVCVEPVDRQLLFGTTPREPLEMQMQYHVARVAREPGRVGAVVKGCAKLLGKERLAPAVRKELLAWSLRQADPVHASIGTRVTWWLDPKQGDEGVRSLKLSKLNPGLRAALEKVSRSLAAPAFDVPPEIPLTPGLARNMVPNQLGLLVVSDALKGALAKVRWLEFAPVHLRSGGEVERYWLAYSRKPVAAEHEPRSRPEENPLLDPGKVAKAPKLFRLKDQHLDCYLVDRDYVLGLIRSGLRTGIFIKGAAYGCPLRRGG